MWFWLVVFVFIVIVLIGPGFGISIRIDDGPDHHAGDPVPAIVRQITWELEQSLRRAAPSFLPK